jgi:murein DD-endopeptidase MepM/ murein hydrolase activator NlpD
MKWAVVFAFATVGLAGCMPPFAPPPGYQGGYLMNTDRSRTVVVAPGDTLYAISRRYDVPTKVIADRNGLAPPFTLTVGQRLVLDPTRIHQVSEGETLRAIAARYQVDESVLAAANEIAPPYGLQRGQEIWIPDPITNAAAPARIAATALPPPVTPETKRAPIRGEALPDVPQPAQLPPPISPVPPTQPVPAPAQVPPPAPETEVAIALPRNALPDPAPRAASRFSWPLKGKIVTRFGPAGEGLHNDGINIAAPKGTQVRAADNGVVAYSGNELKGFGNLLLIKHADGWTTAYAHNDRLLVKRGDKVAQGQVIATVGRSGNVDSPQLHFEVRKGTQAMDPMEYLAQAGG